MYLQLHVRDLFLNFDLSGSGPDGRWRWRWVCGGVDVGSGLGAGGRCGLGEGEREDVMGSLRKIQGQIGWYVVFWIEM